MLNLFLIALSLTMIDPSLSLISNGRIFGGSNAPAGAFPWTVSIRFINPSNTSSIIPVCAGSILTDRFVLTAASCFFGAQGAPQVFSVRAGIRSFFSSNVTTEQIRAASQIFVHPLYNPSTYLNDLALVRVMTPFTFQPSLVQNVSVTNLTEFDEAYLTAVGWGALDQSNSTVRADYLQQVIVQEDTDCTRNRSIDPKLQLCAPGTCLGDSGGPLMIHSDDCEHYELVAVTGFRNACTTEGLFTRVGPYLKWISAIINADSTTTPPRTTVSTTITPTVTFGPAIEFVCNTSYTCGCSPLPVIFHDDPARHFGRPKIQGRIVGGEEAQPSSWSWIVSVQVPPLGHTCGGSLINDRWVLTAAHCLLIANITMVRASIHDTFGAGQERRVITVIRHPNFVPGPRFINDIALLRLSEPVSLSQTGLLATTTCLPPQSSDLEYPLPGSRLAVIGWGRLSENGPAPRRLQQVRVFTLRNEDGRCSNATFDQQRQFCAMVDGGGKDACQGDSGGPIHQWLGDHWEQVGIVSFGTGCAEPNNPGVYTRLAFYYDWIHSTIRNEEEQITTVANGMSTASTTLGRNTATIDVTSTVMPLNISIPEMTTTTTVLSSSEETVSQTSVPCCDTTEEPATRAVNSMKMSSGKADSWNNYFRRHSRNRIHV